MRVIHLRRTILPPTETFIYSQLIHLPPEKAVVLTRDVQNLESFHGLTVSAFSQESENWHKCWSRFNYRIFRRMTKFERDFYVREILAFKPDLLHVHFAVDAAYFSNVWRQVHLPVVVSCYGYDISSFPNRYGGWGGHYLQKVWRFASLILAMSNDMREDLLRLGCPDEKIRVHYHGINLERFKYVDRGSDVKKVRILFVGSLTRRKGVEDILRAFAQIAKQRPQTELRFVGSGVIRSNLEQMARSWGLESRVSFAGFIEHKKLQDELSFAHIFCHPSRTLINGDKEGIPGTIVEAMATGLPVVTTKHAGIPEMVRDGVDGFVVAEGDVTAITQALLTLVDRPYLRAQMGRKAMKQIHELANVVRRTADLEAIYRDVIALKRVR